MRVRSMRADSSVRKLINRSLSDLADAPSARVLSCNSVSPTSEIFARSLSSQARNSTSNSSFVRGRSLTWR